MKVAKRTDRLRNYSLFRFKDHPYFPQAFNVVFHKAVEMADPFEDVKIRVHTLIDCVTYSSFNYISRGLFERDKLTFTAQLAFQV